MYVARKWFEGFEKGDTKVNMRKPCKKRSLVGSWKGPYDFGCSKDAKGFQERNEGNKTCILKDLDDKHWEWARRDLQIYHSTLKDLVIQLNLLTQVHVT